MVNRRKARDRLRGQLVYLNKILQINVQRLTLTVEDCLERESTVDKLKASPRKFWKVFNFDSTLNFFSVIKKAGYLMPK